MTDRVKVWGSTTRLDIPPTSLKNANAPASLEAYAAQFEEGRTKRWDLAAHLLREAAEAIRERDALLKIFAILGEHEGLQMRRLWLLSKLDEDDSKAERWNRRAEAWEKPTTAANEILARGEEPEIADPSHD